MLSSGIDCSCATSCTHIVHGELEARSDRFAHIDQHHHLERGFIGTRETPEIAYHAFVIDNRKV